MPDERPSEIPRRKGRGRIILADPDPSARAAAAEALRADGYRVVEAATSQEAEAAFWAEPNTELLIASFALPGAGGSRLGAILRTLNPGLKVLLLPPESADGLLAAVRDVLGRR